MKETYWVFGFATIVITCCTLLIAAVWREQEREEEQQKQALEKHLKQSQDRLKTMGFGAYEFIEQSTIHSSLWRAINSDHVIQELICIGDDHVECSIVSKP